VLQAIWFVVLVWAMDVKIVTIDNYYRHCQIHTIEGPGHATLTDEDLIDKDVIDELEL
jgi:hypothetical protein